MPFNSGAAALLAVLLIASAVSRAAFAALFSAGRGRISALAESGDKRAAAAEKLANNPNKLAALSLVTETALDLSAGAAFAAGFGLPANMAAWVVLAAASMVWIITAKALPRELGRVTADRSVLIFAPALAAVSVVLTPFTAAASLGQKLTGGRRRAMTENELKKLVYVSHEEGVIEESEREMISNVFDFQDSSAADVMIPRTEITALSADASYAETLNMFRERPFSRLPVYDGDVDDIIGILHIKDFFFGAVPDNFDARGLTRPAFFSYETNSTSKLFAQMREGGITMAVILDEYGGTVGLVTVQDLVEEIVGDITDEYDEPETEDIEPAGDGVFLADGSVKIDDFNGYAGTRLFSEESDSIAGLVMELCGAVPSVGDAAVTPDGSVAFTVVSMARNRITRLRAEIREK